MNADPRLCLHDQMERDQKASVNHLPKQESRASYHGTHALACYSWSFSK